ncbi:Hypothetical protein EHI5A_273020 [Entamoeba histolytica KU27]|uniref:Uncharacterized protein n=1 Tax=Entamoeba histolytica KU27 TaxID=885311 RepID=M2RVQ1_ENTHI|nr:Hypothetical protein EHI5A_273020 [Entamoeba histolytica KU27]
MSNLSTSRMLICTENSVVELMDLNTMKNKRRFKVNLIKILLIKLNNKLL